MNYATGKKGSLKWIASIIIALVLASYFFDFSVKEAIEDPQTQSNFSYLSTNVSNFYNEKIKKHVDYFWKDIFIDLLWDSFKGDLEKMKNGEPTNFIGAAPQVNFE